ncbi:30S ribosomal protein S20 [Candidatus Finniella inopinata]|uniref:Small ribosomal subunit protein bS20 n=1 Tax=Candidatus Finniella inopinata TaxID=1696036 RepID=A0A4Q7DK68_9PROT|nr:30S ribosomal protein S20 [Candidatus Finniella inopinata]RZI46585.1 30S ribosomal protein S20 [Candidatus Finniella inopinata]
MASHKSAEKCIRKIERRTAVNKNRMSRIRTFIKKLEDLLIPGTPKEQLTVALVQAEREIKRGVTKGVLHRNTAARKVSRLAKRAKALA